MVHDCLIKKISLCRMRKKGYLRLRVNGVGL